MPRSVNWTLAIAYVAVYVLLDRISYVHPLAPYGITPWNPPPGLRVALPEVARNVRRRMRKTLSLVGLAFIADRKSVV